MERLMRDDNQSYLPQGLDREHPQLLLAEILESGLHGAVDRPRTLSRGQVAEGMGPPSNLLHPVFPRDQLP